jgi:hypothetical protein
VRQWKVIFEVPLLRENVEALTRVVLRIKCMTNAQTLSYIGVVFESLERYQSNLSHKRHDLINSNETCSTARAIFNLPVNRTQPLGRLYMKRQHYGI